jgi:hypothetical protein
MHPLQIAISLLLVLSAAIVLMTAFQASTEVVPDLEFFNEVIYYEKKRTTLVKAMVEEVRKLKVKGVRKVAVKFLLKNANEYLKFGIWGAAALEASRAFKLSRTTSERGQT